MVASDPPILPRSCSPPELVAKPPPEFTLVSFELSVFVGPVNVVTDGIACEQATLKSIIKAIVIQHTFRMFSYRETTGNYLI